MIRTLLASSKILNNCCKFIPRSFTLYHPTGMLLRSVQSFSQEKARQPRNKQEAWMMQEQKNLKSAPIEDQMEGKTYTGVTRFGVVGFLILTAGLLYMTFTANKRSQQNLDVIQDDISGLKQFKDQQSLVGGDWTLLNSEGQPFSSHNLRGNYYLIFFGYTKCPQTTPSALYYLSSVYRIIRNLPEGAYLKFKIVFVSIDPERDTPPVVKSYLTHFGKHIIGVTASSPEDIQLKQMMKKFKITAKKEQFKTEGIKKDKYLLDYTMRVFLMDPDNIYLYHINPTLTEQQSAKAIITKIVQNEHRKEKADQLLQK